MRSLWETMLSHWLGRRAEPAAAEAPEIAVAVCREPAAPAAAAPPDRTPADPAPAVDDIEADRALG